MLNVQQIAQYLPHRYPFLLVDRILEVEEGKRIIGIKNVTYDEPFFAGHFPNLPVMPGVLILEAMTQVGGVLALRAIGQQGMIAYFLGIDRAKFRRPVVPGDQIRFEVEVIRHRGKIWRFKGLAYVDGKLIAEAELQVMLTEMRAGNDLSHLSVDTAGE